MLISNSSSFNTPLGQFALKFLQFEIENQLFQRQLEGTPYWNFIRYHIYESLLVRQALIDQPHFPHVVLGRRRILEKVLRLVRNAPKLLLETFCILWSRTRYDVILFDAGRRKLYDGQWRNVQFYPFIKAVESEAKILFVEDGHPDLAPAPGIYPCDRSNVRLFLLFAKLRGQFFHFKPALFQSYYQTNF